MGGGGGGFKMHKHIWLLKTVKRRKIYEILNKRHNSNRKENLYNRIRLENLAQNWKKSKLRVF